MMTVTVRRRVWYALILAALLIRAVVDPGKGPPGCSSTVTGVHTGAC